ncbi:Crp/Fnr family transcriptional regulator [Candidatus Thioglobus sp.]|uniref:Crp/Fnr family transcriptional regulator n=1 Tax=Candidatus Thioglobus sp. TaxID=2026721 RepID=UPI003D0FAEB3
MTTNPNSKDANCSKCTVRSRALFGAIGDENIRVTQKYRDKHCHFSKGSILHREQSKIDYAFTLYSGCLILYNDFENGTRQIIRVALPGDFIGFSRNSKGELPYSIQAVTDSKICLFFDTNVSKMRPCKPDCVKSSSKIRHNPLIYPHVGL